MNRSKTYLPTGNISTNKLTDINISKRQFSFDQAKQGLDDYR